MVFLYVVMYELTVCWLRDSSLHKLTFILFSPRTLRECVVVSCAILYMYVFKVHDGAQIHTRSIVLHGHMYAIIYLYLCIFT